MPDVLDSPSVVARARASWLCPTAAWVSQILIAVVLRGSHGLALFYLCAALGQLALLVIGLTLAIGVLARGRTGVSASAWWSAIVGLVVSGGTVLLIVGLCAGALLVR